MINEQMAISLKEKIKCLNHPIFGFVNPLKCVSDGVVNGEDFDGDFHTYKIT
tara:strand:+ start:28 stop:183 length:156 start_codon:yes stop_codon:yes gene_type:complete